MLHELLSNEKVIRIAWIIVIALILCKAVLVMFKKLTNSQFNPDNRNTLVFKFMSRVVIAIIMITTAFQITMALAGSKADFSTLLASSGVITVVLGFAAQESLGNVISGFFIMCFKPFVVGDRVVLANSNITGYVEDITLRHTIIRTYFNSRYIIPNSKMNSEVIENSSLIDERAGMYLDVMIALDADVDKAVSIIQETIAQNPNILDLRSEEDKKNNIPISKVSVRNISLYGIELRSSVWAVNVDASFNILSDLRIQVIKNLRQEGIALAKLNGVNKIDFDEKS